MGASNVKAVYAVWAAIPDPAFRLLVYIALTTRDEDCPPVFWGGQESLAIGLGRRPPFTPADWRAVDRAMAKLRTHGALKPRGGSAPGQTARHEVVLTPDAVRQVNTRREASVEHPTPGDSNTRRPASEHPTPRVVLRKNRNHQD